MLKTRILNVAAIAALALAGCSSGGDMTAKETEALKNPPKTMPPQAVAGMAKGADLMKKQQEANAAAGIDSRGIPISKAPKTP